MGRADLACKDDTLTVIKSSVDALTERNLAGFSQACRHLAFMLGATRINIGKNAADPHVLAALRHAISEGMQ